MNSSPRTVLRGATAAQAVTFTPDALTDLPVMPSGEVLTVNEAAHNDNVLGMGHDPASDAPRSTRGRLHFDDVYAEQMAALREQANREGFEAGHAEGMSVAQQVIAEMVETMRLQVQDEQVAWREQAQATLAALAGSVAALDARTAPAFNEMTASLSEAAFTLVSDMLGRELALAADPTRDAVERALRLVPADAPAVVRLNPDDLAALDAEWVASLRATVTLLPDPSVERSGAVAESGARRVDAQLSTALARVQEALNA